jgi:hypothetical protein
VNEPIQIRVLMAVRGGLRSRNQSFVVNANELFSTESYMSRRCPV